MEKILRPIIGDLRPGDLISGFHIYRIWKTALVVSIEKIGNYNLAPVAQQQKVYIANVGLFIEGEVVYWKELWFGTFNGDIARF